MTEEPSQRRVQIYVAHNGKAPFEEWMHSLRDKQTRARILTRIDRVRLGNLGDCASVGAGVYELRIHFGPGYRVYFGLHGAEVVLLLCAGAKSSQARDVELARSYWREFNGS
jgi:putative addiction module killer protein